MPLAQSLFQLRCNAFELGAGRQLAAEHLGASFVAGNHALIVRNHQNPGAHALDDQLVELLHAGQAGGLFACEYLGQVQAPADPLHEHGHGKVDGAEHPGLQVALADIRMGQAEEERQVD